MISRLLIISIKNLDLTAFFQKYNLHRIKDGAFVINLNDKKRKGTHSSRSIKQNQRQINYNISIIQDDSILCGFYCIDFRECMLAGKTLDYTNLFSPNDYKKNDKITDKYFNNIHDRQSKT